MRVRLRSTMTQSVFAVPDPKENIHEQACIHTRHPSGSEPEHCGVCSNLYHCLDGLHWHYGSKNKKVVTKHTPAAKAVKTKVAS